MVDQIISVNQDIDDNSYTFNYILEDGKGNTLAKSINVLMGEATDLNSAKIVADQRAADAKRDWINTPSVDQEVVGPVVLPPSS